MRRPAAQSGEAPGKKMHSPREASSWLPGGDSPAPHPSAAPGAWPRCTAERPCGQTAQFPQTVLAAGTTDRLWPVSTMTNAESHCRRISRLSFPLRSLIKLNFNTRRIFFKTTETINEDNFTFKKIFRNQYFGLIFHLSFPTYRRI